MRLGAPVGAEQEMWALLVLYRLLCRAIGRGGGVPAGHRSTTRPQGSFTHAFILAWQRITELPAAT
ncbi:hypothetical protein [Amycolatopsis sp. cmx-4-61]|uniref:hypothetical protein n=1 Tax=Amycolatopsis sp. cmx-4-61 TaxID=2790937 RepID=UPI00397D386F